MHFKRGDFKIITFVVKKTYFLLHIVYIFVDMLPLGAKNMECQKNNALSRREMIKASAYALIMSIAAGTAAITADVRTASASKLNIVNNFSPLNRTRPSRPHTRYIILHTTEGGDQGSLNKLVRLGEAHYFIARNGRVSRIIDKAKIAKHAGRSMWEGRSTLDNHSIGIEVSGYHNQDITAAQYESLKEVVRQLKSLYKITDDKVMPHSMVAYGRPNRFHDENHRGRKRCGMMFADPKVRTRLGLGPAPNRDPDVQARRLIVADKELYAYLFPSTGSGTSSKVQIAKTQTPAKPSPVAPPVEMETAVALPVEDTEEEVPTEIVEAPKTVTAPKTAADPPSESHEITLIRTAWQIARERYNSPTTIYEFPDGQRFNGSQIKDWGFIPAGTRVYLDANYDSEAFEGFLEIGKDGDTPQALAGKAYAGATTIYFFPDGLVRTGAELQRQASYRSLFNNPPKGTRLLVGYVYGGSVRNSRRPSAIAGIKWNYPSTYYRLPDGRILSGDDVGDRSIPVGTLVFFQE